MDQEQRLLVAAGLNVDQRRMRPSCLRGGSSGSCAERGDDLSQTQDRRRLQEAVRRQLDRQRVADPGEHLNRLQGVAAELEEVVVDAYMLDAQRLLPDAGERLLDSVARSDIRRRQNRPIVQRSRIMPAHEAEVGYLLRPRSSIDPG